MKSPGISASIGGKNKTLYMQSVESIEKRTRVNLSKTLGGELFLCSDSFSGLTRVYGSETLAFLSRIGTRRWARNNRRRRHVPECRSISTCSERWNGIVSIGRINDSRLFLFCVLVPSDICAPSAILKLYWMYIYYRIVMQFILLFILLRSFHSSSSLPCPSSGGPCCRSSEDTITRQTRI